MVMFNLNHHKQKLLHLHLMLVQALHLVMKSSELNSKQQPAGFTTFIGIQTGYWANGGNFVAITTTGVGCTQYIVRLDNAGQISGITTGDVVKLTGHQTGPNIQSKELTVQERLGSDRVIFNFSSINATSHGSTAVDGDYISIRRIFTIAKGRVGVT